MTAKQITNFDHHVLTVYNVDATVRFYMRLLGMRTWKFGGGWTAGMAFAGSGTDWSME